MNKPSRAQMQSWDRSRLPRIHPQLDRLFADTPEAAFLVLFREQVEASAAFARGITEARNAPDAPSARSLRAAGRAEVVRVLREQSARTQADLHSLLHHLLSSGEIRCYTPFYVINAMAATGTRTAVHRLAAHPAVAEIVPDRTILLDPEISVAMADRPRTASIEWNIAQIGAPQVWQLGYDGTGVVVGCIDTGVEYSHPALEPKFRGFNPADPSSPTVIGNWFDAVNENHSLPYDDNRHGTHVTGTMVGATADGSRQIGVAPGARWIAVKAFNALGQAQSSWLLRAGEWVLAPLDQAGVPHPEWAPDVVNNSWGGAAGLDEWYRPMLINWRAAAIMPVFSAGNSGPGSATVGVPGNYPEALAVGAVNQENQLAVFSSRGPSPYGETKPEVVAPGVSIRSAIPGGDYGFLSGTSMAAPHVAGAVALLLSADPALSLDEIEALLRDTATPLTDAQFPQVPNDGYGFGLAQVFDAVSETLLGRGTIVGRVSVPGEDVESPAVVHTPVERVYAGLGIQIVADALDNTGVTEVHLLIRTPDATEDVVLLMARTEGDHRSGRYVGSIPYDLVTTAGLSYRIRARDAAANELVHGPHTVEVRAALTVGYQQDFESSPEGFTSGGVNNPWQWGIPVYPPPVSGRRLYGTNLQGTGYQAQTNAFLIMPPIDMTTTNRAQLRFRQWVDTQAYLDFADIYVSTNGGDSWSRVMRQSGASGGWILSYLDLAPHTGSTLLVMFNLLSDRIVNGRGWFLDDLAIIGPTGQRPSPPTDLSASPTAMGSIHVTWSAPLAGDVTTYAVLRSHVAGEVGTEVGRTTGPSFFDNTAPQGLPSYYRVVAVDVWGEQSAPSAAVSATPEAVDILFFDDMESGPDGWSTSTDRNQWEWGVPQSIPAHAFSGTHLWGTGLNRSYETAVTCWLMSPAISLQGRQSVALQFAHWYHTEFNYDLCDVEITQDNGVHWVRLARYSGFSGGWHQPIIDLTPYAEQTVRIRFRFSSDQANSFPGWYLDDVRLAAVSVPESRQEPPAIPVLCKGVGETPPLAAPMRLSPSAHIHLLPAEASVLVRETGRRVMTDPASGQYEMRHGVGTWTLVAEAYGYWLAERQITLGVGETVTADFQLEPMGQGLVEGTVRHGQTGLPVAGVEVRVTEDRSVEPVLTDAAGWFQLQVLEGPYTLQVRKPHFYTLRLDVVVPPGATVPVALSLAPFISGQQQEIAYDDGTFENAWAWAEGGNGWAVRMRVADPVGVKLTQARILLMDTRWPLPGGTQFGVAVFDSDGPDGAPGTLLVPQFSVIGHRDGQWTEANCESFGLVLQRDFYVAYVQEGTFPRVPGLTSDQSSPYAGVSWQLFAQAWQPSPPAEGNRMIRAVVRAPSGAPTIVEPRSGAHTNQPLIEVRGVAPGGTLVGVTVDGAEVGRVPASDGGFVIPVALTPGAHEVAASIVEEHGQGPLSEPVIIVLDQVPPTLEVTSPPDQERTNRETVDVIGRVADNLTIDWLLVNDQPVTPDTDGRFSVRIALREGENLIRISAADRAGNATVVTRTVFAQWDLPSPPLILSPSPDHFTASPSIVVSGVAPEAEQVMILREGSEAGVAVVNHGLFAVAVSLVEGPNTLTAVATRGTESSPPSDPVVVHLDRVPPAVTVDHPPAGEGALTTREVVEVSGQVTDDSAPVSAFVNGQPAQVGPDGRFTHPLPVRPGLNTILVRGIDRAGNETTVTRTIMVKARPVCLANLTPCWNITLRTGESLVLACDGEPGAQVSYLIVPPVADGGSPVTGYLTEESPGAYRGLFTATAAMAFAQAIVAYHLRTADGAMGASTAPGHLTVDPGER